MKKITTGYTNDVFQDEEKILVIKNNNGFNHKINYLLLKEFDFVPELISNNKEKQEWKFVEGKMLDKPTNTDLVNLASILRKVHLSDVKFPKNNLRERIKTYLIIIHDKLLNIPEIEDNWKLMNNLLAKMGHKNPIHNDVWWQNIIKGGDSKLWLVDWEYATMGDKHFDLAFYIESALLSAEQEKVFLEAYNSHDSYQAYIPQWMDRYKMFVNWFTLIWAYAQEELPFPVENLKNRITQLKIKIY